MFRSLSCPVASSVDAMAIIMLLIMLIADSTCPKSRWSSTTNPPQIQPRNLTSSQPSQSVVPFETSQSPQLTTLHPLSLPHAIHSTPPTPLLPCSSQTPANNFLTTLVFCPIP